MSSKPSVDPKGLPCLDDDEEAFNEEDDGDEAGGLVTGSIMASPDSSEDE